MFNIPLSVPSIQGNEWTYIKECLDTEWVSSAGKYVDLFEERIAAFTGAKNAIACVNGTSALQVSLRLAGVQPDDEVIVPTLTFIAPVNAITYNGARPVFMDADVFYNLDVQKTIDFIHNETELINSPDPVTINKTSKKRISAIIPVHIWGNAVWLNELAPLCKERNIAIVEDASESLGTRYTQGIYNGRHTGTIGLLGCISFNGNKIMTTGGGGMILTDDDTLADKARYLTTQAKDDPVRYVHHEIGYNFRMTNIQAALGVAQLEQLPSFLERKQEVYESYKTGLKDQTGIQLVETPDYARNNHWMNVVKIRDVTNSEPREQLMKHLHQNGIQTRPVWALNHLQKPYQDCLHFQMSQASDLVSSSLCLPSSSNLKDEELHHVIQMLIDSNR